MSRRLRDELERIAAAAPVADVPESTWARAQQARRRGRVASVAATAAAVAVVAGLLTWLPGRSAPPMPAGSPAGRPGVPAYVWAVPERMAAQGNDGSWLRDEVEGDLAVGRAAVAFATPGGLPVVVGAGDGAYHLLDLPGWPGKQLLLRTSESSLGLALSPDGRKLAFAWAGRATATAPVPSGVRVVDLETGEVRTIRVRGGEGVVVNAVVWSPDSVWLAWRGDRKSSWTASSVGGSTRVAGRIAPGSRTSEPVPPGSQDDASAVAVTNDGRVTVLAPGATTRWDGDLVVRQPSKVPDELEMRAAASPDGTTVALGRWRPDGALSLDLPRDHVVRHQLPRDVYPAGATARPLGWIGDDLVVSEVQPVTAADQPEGDAQIVVATRARSQTSTYRIVAGLATGVGDSLSVAVDLMTLARPTVERPEPRWPWSDERKAVVGGAAALVLLGGGLLGLRWRRRRPW